MQIAIRFLHIAAQLKLYHWQTSSHARHEAVDKLVTSFSQKADKFVEVMQGLTRTRIVLPAGASMSIPFTNLSDAAAVEFLTQVRAYLHDEVGNYVSDKPELINILGELLEDVAQTMYLFSFT